MEFKVIDLGVNRKSICDFLLVINCIFSCTCYRFRDSRLTLEDRKLLILPTHPLFDAPAAARGNPSEFLDETYPAKNRGMGLPYGENCLILTSTVFVWSTHLTDGRTDRETGDSIIRAIAYMQKQRNSGHWAKIKSATECTCTAMMGLADQYLSAVE